MKLRSYIIRDELNGPQALRFADTLAQQADDLDAIELSLRHATGVDVAGLAVLVRVKSQMQSRGRQVAITNAPRHVRAAFADLGLEHLLTEQKAERRWRISLPTIGRRAYA